MTHRLYGHARDRHEFTWNLQINKGFRMSNFRYHGQAVLALSATTLNNVTVRRDGRIDGISKSVAGFVEPMKEKK